MPSPACVAITIIDEHGRPKYLVAMSTDITDQKRAAAALRASEGKFEGLMAASPDAVVAVDGKGTIVLANARVRDIFGYEPDELIGQNAALISPQATAEEVRNRIREALAAAGLGQEGTPREVTFMPFEDDPNRARMGAFADLAIELRFDPARRGSSNFRLIPLAATRAIMRRWC